MATSVNSVKSIINNKYYSITLHLISSNNQIIPSNDIYTNNSGFTILAKSWEWNGTQWNEFGDGWGGPGQHGSNNSFKWSQDNTNVSYSSNNGRGFTIPTGKSTTTISLEIFGCKGDITLNIKQPTSSSLQTNTSINNIYDVNYDLSPASSNLLASTANQTVSTKQTAPEQIMDDYKINNSNPTFIVSATGTGTSNNPYVIDNKTLSNDTNVILPYLQNGKTVKIDNATIVRDNNKLVVTINGIPRSYNLGDSFVFNDKIYTINAVETFNNNIVEPYNYNIIEHLPGVALSVSSVPPPVTNNPTKFYDYIFYLCYPVSFLGAIFYALICIISVDPASILINKNWSVAFNIYVGLCAITSVFIWFNYPNPVLGTNVYNPKSYRKSFR